MEPLVMTDGEYSASLDGISLSGDLILEVKCPAKGRSSETWQAVEAGSVPEHYYWQVQHQLMVTKAGKAHFYVFDEDSGSGIWVEVLPNVQDMDQLQMAWNQFMLHVDNDEPPPLTDLDTVVRQDVDWQQAALAYVSAKSQADRAIEAVESAKARLVTLSQHSSEKGFGVSVSKYWKASSGRQEVRISLLKSEQQPC
jgi:predicted phage-related endonuclease